MNEVSDQEYWNRLRFGQEFTAAAQLHRMPMEGSYDRFHGMRDEMTRYFEVSKVRAVTTEQEITNDFDARDAKARADFMEEINTLTTQNMDTENPNTWLDQSQLDWVELLMVQLLFLVLFISAFLSHFVVSVEQFI